MVEKTILLPHWDAGPHFKLLFLKMKEYLKLEYKKT